MRSAGYLFRCCHFASRFFQGWNEAMQFGAEEAMRQWSVYARSNFGQQRASLHHQSICHHFFSLRWKLWSDYSYVMISNSLLHGDLFLVNTGWAYHRREKGIIYGPWENSWICWLTCFSGRRDKANLARARSRGSFCRLWCCTPWMSSWSVFQLIVFNNQSSTSTQ